MGFFSGISKALGTVGDLVGAVTSPISSVMGVAAPFMEQQSVDRANAANSAMSAEQMRWQEVQNQKAMDFTAGQNLAANQFTSGQQERKYWLDYAGQNRANAFSERMASTQFQRGVKDMRAAGLNPMLAVSQGGAAAPSGVAMPASAGQGASGMGTSSAGSMAVHRPAFQAQSVASAASASKMLAEVQNVKAQNDVLRAQADNVKMDTVLKGSQSYQSTSQGHVNQLQERKLQETIGPIVDQIRASADQSRSSAEQTRSQNLLMKDLMANPVTRPFAPLLNLIFK